MGQQGVTQVKVGVAIVGLDLEGMPKVPNGLIELDL